MDVHKPGGWDGVHIRFLPSTPSDHEAAISGIHTSPTWKAAHTWEKPNLLEAVSSLESTPLFCHSS